jgi:uncharacterized membrane protein
MKLVTALGKICWTLSIPLVISGFVTPAQKSQHPVALALMRQHHDRHNFVEYASLNGRLNIDVSMKMMIMMTATTAILTLTSLPDPVIAATTATTATVDPVAVPASAAMVASAGSMSSSMTLAGPVSGALAAYGHYVGLFGMVGCLMTERITLENAPSLSDGEETRLTITDALYGIFGLLVFYTGYCRLTDISLGGKGADFYIHEPLFWLKLTMAGILASTSFFNTTKIIQRAVAKRNNNGAVEPLSDALVARMKQICNAQLSGILFIPLAATFMARGVGYNESIPWQAEAALALIVTLGLSFKYIKEALTFEDKK